MNDDYKCDEKWVMETEPCIGLGSLQPAHNISFSNGEKEVGKIDFSTGKMVFEGDMEESAKVFFDYLKDILIDPYLERKEREK